MRQLIEPENSEEMALEYRDKPKFIEIFGTFGPSGFCCEERNRHLFNLSDCSKLTFFDWDLNGKHHTSTNVESWVWNSRWVRTQPSVRFRTLKFCYKNQIKNFSNQPLSTIIELSTDTLRGETKQIATQNIKFEDSVKSVSKPVFGSSVPSWFWCKKKPDYFLIDWFVNSTKKLIGFLMQQIEPENSEKIEFEVEINQNA